MAGEEQGGIGRVWGQCQDFALLAEEFGGADGLVDAEAPFDL